MLREMLSAIMLTVATFMLHAAAGVWLVRLTRYRTRQREQHRLSPVRDAVFVLKSMSEAVIILLLAHMAGAMVWAEFFLLRHGFKSFEPSLYFSITSYTTIGYGDILLPRALRITGALEGMVGTLMFGLSIALLSSLLQNMLLRGKKP